MNSFEEALEGEMNMEESDETCNNCYLVVYCLCKQTRKIEHQHKIKNSVDWDKMPALLHQLSGNEIGLLLLIDRQNLHKL